MVVYIFILLFIILVLSAIIIATTINRPKSELLPPKLNNNPSWDVVLTELTPLLSFTNSKGGHLGKRYDIEIDESKKFAQLPIKEPHTNLRRLSDKIVYEISVPGVKSIENVSIVKMGNSIEVKAISKEHSYFKIIPLDLDILNYEISDETIVLELRE